MRSCHNIPLILFVHVCLFSLGNRGRRTSRMSCTYLSKLLLTTMIINELQTSTAITSKKPYPLNTNKLANIHPATQLNSQCSAITLLDRQSTETTACRLNLPLLSQKKIQAIIIHPTAKLSHPLHHPFTPPLAFTNALPTPLSSPPHSFPLISPLCCTLPITLSLSSLQVSVGTEAMHEK